MEMEMKMMEMVMKMEMEIQDSDGIQPGQKRPIPCFLLSSFLPFFLPPRVLDSLLYPVACKEEHKDDRRWAVRGH